MRSGAISAGPGPGGARSCAANRLARDGSAPRARTTTEDSGVTALADESVELLGVVRRVSRAEWSEQSCGAALNVKLPSAGSSLPRWQEPSAGGASTATTAAAGPGQQSSAQASVAPGDARSATTRANAAELRSSIALSIVTHDRRKSFTAPATPSRALLDHGGQVGHNRRTVKRLCLVLFVCLSVQLSAASAPFLHLHARAAAGGHPDKAVVHRHAPSHHHSVDDAPADDPQLDSASVASPDTVAAIALGGVTAKLPRTAASLAPPVAAPQAVAAPRPAIPPDDVGDALPNSPHSRSSSHRGPPR